MLFNLKKILLLLSVAVCFKSFGGKVLPYSVADKPWEEKLGNHRVVISIPSNAGAVKVEICWRRRDEDAVQKRLIITDTDGNPVKNIFRVKIDRENGTFFFQPFKNITKYYIYYMPWQGKKESGYFDGSYLSPEQPAEEDWVLKNHLRDGSKKFPLARVECIQSRTAFDSFYPMEVIATKKEVQQLVQRNGSGFMLFPEKRNYPIRMQDDLPQKWILSGEKNVFNDTACGNEYFTFQAGVFAATDALEKISVEYSGSEFPVTCFNLEGTDSKGKYFVKQVDIQKGKVQPLWFGVDIPRDAKVGRHNFSVTVKSKNGAKKTISVSLYITDKILEDRGDGELWRHARLRWLNSTLGIDHSVVAPYKPLQVADHVIKAATGSVELNDFGLPVSIEANGSKVLQSSLNFVVETHDGIERVQMDALRFNRKEDGMVEWQGSASNNKMKLLCKGVLESDGYINYSIKVIANEELQVRDIRLELPVKKQYAQYFMGMGLPGTFCPANYSWKWHGPQDAFWIGTADAGLWCELRGATYSGPLLNLYHPKPPVAWFNDNLGGFNISSSNETVTANATSGSRVFKAGDSMNFDFALLITPVKKINTHDQFINRYYHNGAAPAPAGSDLQSGIKIINVHHANAVNPYINYPFISSDSIKKFAALWHARGLKVKMYYTIRELSDQATELWALRSLGAEIFANGDGGGYLWLREHLVKNYKPEWFTTINGYEASDAAILTSDDSRWYNYYIEGLYWLVKNTDIDGLYLDDVAYDRNMLKRMRKVMDKAKPGCMLDLHSNTGFSKGPATQYTEFFPYLDKLWLGESFQYNKMPPENWLVEVSGIPFGLMGDMLHAGGNPWRGMVYGMTVRYPWFTEGVNCDPRDIWKVWDAFGIENATMKGYWDKDSIIATSDTSVLATAYIKNDRLMVAVASWASANVKVRLNVDWQKVGWLPSENVAAPGIEKYQPAASFKIDEPIEIEPGKGWLLIYDKKNSVPAKR